MQHIVIKIGEWDDDISIHAPYKGCNAVCRLLFRGAVMISIHAPYKGCNLTTKSCLTWKNIFQSMHPIKDATDS